MSKPKIEFPIFSREDVEGWIYTMEQMLEFYNIALDQRVRVAAMHLKGSPLQWYRWLVRTNRGGSSMVGVREEHYVIVWGKNGDGYSGELTKLK